MIERRIGGSDMTSSLIGYGCWQIGMRDWPGVTDTASLAAIRAALDMGVDYFDTAPVYGLGHSEEVLGRALAGRRNAVTIATKVGLLWDRGGRVRRDLGEVRREIDDSLKRLRTDRIDLIQVHWNDYKTPIEDVMEAFGIARDAGKVRWFGVCNLDAETMDRARRCDELVSAQVLYNLIDRNASQYITETLDYRTEDEVLPYCRDNAMGLIPYSPLGQGFLSDGFDWRALPEGDVRRLNQMFEANVRRREELAGIARDAGLTLSQLAIAWLARKPEIPTIIAGSTNPRHIEANIEALEYVDRIPDVD